jgi:polyhydroxybutyrate depolymerase
MLNKYFSILAFCITFISCANADTITVDGLERSYIVHLPKNFVQTKRTPLVIALHGGRGKADGMDRLTGFNNVSDKYGFIVIYPDGVKKQWNDGRNDFHLNDKIDDVKFISVLIDTLKALYNIDSNRVYVTGISNGGIMSFRLACELSNKIAAAAPVAASMPESPVYKCSPLRPVPMMIIFGDEDPLVPFNGGDISIFGLSSRGKVIPVKESVSYWVNFNGCSSNSIISQIDNADDDTKAIKNDYQDNPLKKNNSEVVFWLIKGGGHTWPGGLQYLPKAIIGRTSSQINASEEIWKFFEDKTLN